MIDYRLEITCTSRVAPFASQLLTQKQCSFNRSHGRRISISLSNRSISESESPGRLTYITTHTVLLVLLPQLGVEDECAYHRGTKSHCAWCRAPVILCRATTSAYLRSLQALHSIYCLYLGPVIRTEIVHRHCNFSQKYIRMSRIWESAARYKVCIQLTLLSLLTDFNMIRWSLYWTSFVSGGTENAFTTRE